MKERIKIWMQIKLKFIKMNQFIKNGLKIKIMNNKTN